MERIYLAAPFFNDKERKHMEKVLKVLRNSGYTVFAPYEFVIPDGEKLPNDVWGGLIFQGDIKELDKADIVVAINHGLRSDTGTAFEIGYAYHSKKDIFIVHFDKSIDSLMINNAAKGAINYSDFLNKDKIDLKDYIGKLSQNEQK